MNYPPPGPPNRYPPQQNPYPPPPPGYHGGSPPTVTEGKAVTSLVLGLLSIFCFGILSGIPAIVVGLLSRRDIARSGNTLGGGGIAVGGIVTGAIGSLLSVATFGMMIFGMVTASRAAAGLGSPPSMVAPPVATLAPPATKTVGSIEIAEAHVGAGALRDQLLDARSDAAKTSRTLLVEVRAKWCLATCSALDSALLDPRMQRALADVRILRVDLDDFSTELAPLSMLTQAVPYFYKIDASANVESSLSSDAWDDNTAANMAPVLAAFVRGLALPDAGAASGHPALPSHGLHSSPTVPIPSPTHPPPPYPRRDAGARSGVSL